MMRPCDSKIAGGVLISPGFLIPLAMLHHPTSPSNLLVQPIHAFMIGISLLTLYAITRFAMRLGLARPGPMIGLILYAAGTALGLAAATINGFALPQLAAGAGQHLSSELIVALNQAFATVGVVCVGAAFLVLGSSWLWQSPTRAWRIAACLTLVLGSAPAAMLVVGSFDLDVHGALTVYALQFLAGAIAGLWLAFADDREGEQEAAYEVP